MINTTNKPKTLLTGIAIALLVIAIIVLFKQNPQKNTTADIQTNENTSAPAPNETAVLLEEKNGPLSADKVIKSPRIRNTLDYEDPWCRSDQLNPNGNAIAILESDQWRESRGYYSNHDRLPYTGYDLSTLWSLGNNGDFIALGEITWRSLEIDDSDSADLAARTAAVHGSTSAMSYLAVPFLVDARRLERQGRASEATEKWIDAMSFYEVATMRNDLGLFDSGINLLKRRNREFDDEQLAQISDKAEKIYNDLKKSREDIGLPDFDNSLPKSLKRHFDMIIASNTLNQWNGWGAKYFYDSECVQMNIAVIADLNARRVQLLSNLAEPGNSLK